MHQPEAIQLPLPGRIVLIGYDTFLENGPKRADTQKRGKHMMAVNDVVMPAQDRPPYFRDIGQVHPRTPSFPITIQNIAIYAQGPQRFHLLLDEDAEDRMLRRRIIGRDM